MTLPALRLLAAQPETLDDLSLPELAAILVAVSARLAQKGAESRQPAPGLAPLLTLAEAAPLLGMSAHTLRRAAKKDAAIRAMTVDTGTDRVVFDPLKIARFRERRAG